jgi:hypothetical protein
MLTEDFPMVLLDYLEDLLVSWDLGWLHRCQICVRKIIQVALIIIEGVLRGWWILRQCLQLVSEEEYLDVENQKLFSNLLIVNLGRLPLATHRGPMLRVHALNVIWDYFAHGLTLLLNLGICVR